MKSILMTLALIGSLTANAQSEPRLSSENGLVKATYHHTNGQISQEGYFKDGKPHGQWNAYDESGHKTATGNYENGVKSGKWLFWNKASLSEVDYQESRVAVVKTWKEQVLTNKM